VSTSGKPSSPTKSSSSPGRPPVENSALVKAMRAVAQEDSPANRRVLYKCMVQAWFLVPAREGSELHQPGFHEWQDGSGELFQLEHDSEGVPVQPVFTDEEALRNWNKTLPWIAVPGTALFPAVAASQAEEIVINPYEPADPGSRMIRPGGRVTRCELEALARGGIPQESQAPSEDVQPVLLATPKDMPPPELLQALAAAARRLPAVSGLYFSQVMQSNGGSQGVVAVEFAPGSGDELEQSALARLGKAASESEGGDALGFVAASSELGRAIATSGTRFYQRESCH
jgi:SseB protein N-terminal domain/SseB protein C-terminal domain